MLCEREKKTAAPFPAARASFVIDDQPLTVNTATTVPCSLASLVRCRISTVVNFRVRFYVDPVRTNRNFRSGFRATIECLSFISRALLRCVGASSLTGVKY